MPSFFRFLSFRGGKASAKSALGSVKEPTGISAINQIGHSKLKEGSEDLKESIEHYNQRCLAAKQLNDGQPDDEKM